MIKSAIVSILYFSKHISTTFSVLIGVICLLIMTEQSYGQLISVGSIQDEQLRLNALLADTLTTPLIDRPVSYTAYTQTLDKNNEQNGWWSRNLTSSPLVSNQNVTFGTLPFEIQQTYNSRIPYGENNGAAWYGRGSNVEFKGGFYAASKYVTLNVNPHIIYQENIDFLIPRFIPRDSQGNIRFVAEGIGAALDAPFRFGPDPFTTFDLGTSSIRFHYKKLETGVSTESLWWGPAVRYPLVFSNNARGIPHFLFGSNEPFRIPYFGDIQFKWVFGYPQDSEYYDGEGQDRTRFFTAMNLIYSPVFFKNLTIGVIRVTHLYEDNGFSLKNAVIPFDLTSLSSGFNTGGAQDKNQLASVYAHIQLPGSNAEIYGEFYREDHSFDIRDFVNQPHHNSAYSFGFQKISYIPGIDFLKTNVEITNLTTTQLQQVRPQVFFYTHSRVRQGHTNRGQILGAAIGPGSNSQYLSFDAYKGDYKFGLFIQRWVDNDNFHFRQGSRSRTPSQEFGDFFNHRVNLNVGTNFLYGPGPFYVNGRLTWTKAFNYGRFNLGRLEGVTIRNFEGDDLINIQFQLGLTYIF